MKPLLFKRFLTLSVIISASMIQCIFADEDQYDPSQDSFYQNVTAETEQSIDGSFMNISAGEDVEADGYNFYQDDIDLEEMDEVQYIDADDEDYYDED